MSAWAKGDLALCVDGADWVRAYDGSDAPTDRVFPRSGGVYSVADVLDDHDGLFLVIEEFHGAFIATAFRKINPLTEEQRREALADLGDMVVVS